MKKIINLLILGSAALFLAGCQKASNPVLELVSADTSFGPSESTGLIVVSSTSAVKAVSDKPDWCTATVDDKFITVTVALNDSGAERTAVIAISNEEGKSITVPVSQASVTFEGDFPLELAVSSEGDSYSYPFKTNSELKVSVDPEGNGITAKVEGGNLVITVDENKGKERTSEINWYVDGAKSTFKGIITVTQAKFSKPVNATLIFENYDGSAKRPEATTDHTLLYGVSCGDGDITSFKYYILKKSDYDEDPEYYDENFIDAADEFDDEDLNSLNTKGQCAYIGWSFARGTEYVMLAYIENAVEGKLLKGTASTTALYEEPVEKKIYTKADLIPAESKADFYGSYKFYCTNNNYDTRVTYNTVVTFSDGGIAEDEQTKEEYQLVMTNGIVNNYWNTTISFDYPENYWIYKDGLLYNICDDHGAFKQNGVQVEDFAHVVERISFENVIGMVDSAFVMGFTKEGNLAMVDSEIYKDEQTVVDTGETLKYGAAKWIYYWLYDADYESLGWLWYQGDFFFKPVAGPAAVTTANARGKVNAYHPASEKFGRTASKPIMASCKTSIKNAKARKLCTAKFEN